MGNITFLSTGLIRVRRKSSSSYSRSW